MEFNVTTRPILFAIESGYQDTPDDWWTSGLCAVFAYALRERYGCQIKSLVVKASDGEETMVHTMGVLQGNLYIDATGVHQLLNGQPEIDMFGNQEFSRQDYADLVFRDADDVIVEIETVSLDRLYDLTPEGVEDTAAAHVYIESHPELFGCPDYLKNQQEDTTMPQGKGEHLPICTKVIFFDEHKADLSEWVHNGKLTDEFAFYVENGFKPTHWIEVPGEKDAVWRKGNPSHIDDLIDKQVLTLSPFYPSGNLGASIEVRKTSSLGQYPNHPPFEGVKQWLPVEELREFAKPMPSPHEIRHGKVDRIGDLEIGDLVMLRWGEDRLGRIVSLTEKERRFEDGGKLQTKAEQTVYIAELGKDDPWSMAFDADGNYKGISAASFKKLDLDAVIEGKHKAFGGIKVEHDGDAWRFTHDDTEIDERSVFGMKVLSVDCDSAMRPR